MWTPESADSADCAVDALCGLGATHERFGNFDTARTCYENAVKLLKPDKRYLRNYPRTAYHRILHLQNNLILTLHNAELLESEIKGVEKLTWLEDVARSYLDIDSGSEIAKQYLIAALAGHAARGLAVESLYRIPPVLADICASQGKNLYPDRMLEGTFLSGESHWENLREIKLTHWLRIAFGELDLDRTVVIEIFLETALTWPNLVAVEASDFKWARKHIPWALGLAKLRRGKVEEAKPLFCKALESSTESSESYSMAKLMALTSLGRIAVEQQDQTLAK